MNSLLLLFKIKNLEEPKEISVASHAAHASDNEMEQTLVCERRGFGIRQCAIRLGYLTPPCDASQLKCGGQGFNSYPSVGW
jgi:hypothetical protein